MRVSVLRASRHAVWAATGDVDTVAAVAARRASESKNMRKTSFSKSFTDTRCYTPYARMSPQHIAFVHYHSTRSHRQTHTHESRRAG